MAYNNILFLWISMVSKMQVISQQIFLNSAQIGYGFLFMYECFGNPPVLIICGKQAYIDFLSNLNMEVVMLFLRLLLKDSTESTSHCNCLYL